MRLTELSEKIECKPKKAKARVQDIPNSELVNPMAPEVKTKRTRKHQAAFIPEAPQEVTPQYLVPPGTEPRLPASQITSHGHSFGFQFPEALKGRASVLKRPSRMAISNIDPALTALDEREADDQDMDDQEPEEDATSGSESDKSHASDVDDEGFAVESAGVVDDNAAQWENADEGTVILHLLRLPS